MLNEFISKAIEYCPDWLFAQLYTIYNKHGIRINKYKNHWIISSKDMRIQSPTAKFTSIGIRQFESKFEKYFKIEKGDNCLDVGACIGDTTIPMILKTGEFGRVYAVEPNGLNYEYLTINTRLYRNCIPIRIAVWKEKGQLTFHEHSSPTGHSLIPLSLRKQESIVDTDTLDNLFKGIIFDYAKIDVQSAEIEVLQGATEFLKTTRKLIVECHHDYKNELHNTKSEVFDILRKDYSKIAYSKDYHLFYAWK